jgi:hypothetical protein
MRPRTKKAISCAALAGLALASCASPTPTVPAATLPPGVSVSAITISGLPETLSYGQSVQLTAFATLPNGAQKQSASATWQSSNSAIAAVSETGLLTVTGFGDVNITASAQGVETTARANVPLPPAPVARLAVTIDAHGSTVAVGDVTNVTFDMSGSSGVGLRYAFTFGDGSTVTSTEPIARHVYASPVPGPGGYKPLENHDVRVTVTDAAGRTDSVTRTVTAARLAPGGLAQPYGWTARDAAAPAMQGTYGLHIESMQGRTITGSLDQVNSGLGWQPFTGTFGEDNSLVITLNDGTVRLSGFVKLVGSEYDDTLVFAVSGGRADGRTLTFEHYRP